MNKFAIYTAVVGNYDEIRQPLVVDSRFDYFLFSNTIREKRIGVWQIKPIEYTNPDQIKIARYVKTHPETLLPDYAATLWMDANIQIVDSWVYERFIELYNQGVQLASVKHPERDCIYEEMFTVCSFKWETIETAWRWNRYLRKNKYPKNNGLFETNVLYRVNSAATKKVDEEWWNCIEQYSRRDQLSFNFVLWHNRKECSYFLKEDECVLRSPYLKLILHSDQTHKFVKEKGYISYLWEYYWKLPSSQKRSFYEKWLSILSKPYWMSSFGYYLWRQMIRIKRDWQRYSSKFSSCKQ